MDHRKIAIQREFIALLGRLQPLSSVLSCAIQGHWDGLWRALGHIRYQFSAA
jgi:hypothetical protein